MPRQRSKKITASRETEQKPVPELERVREQYESENDSEDIREKDSDEEELDRLVFGDETEFHAHLGDGMDVDKAEGSEGSEPEEEDREDGNELENVNDADVSQTLHSLPEIEANYLQALLS